MDELLLTWAREARRLELNALNAHDAPEVNVRLFAAIVLDELAAWGLVKGDGIPGCWARPRATGN